MAKVVVYAGRGNDVVVTDAESGDELGRVDRDRHGEFNISPGQDLKIHEITSQEVAKAHEEKYGKPKPAEK